MTPIPLYNSQTVTTLFHTSDRVHFYIVLTKSLVEWGHSVLCWFFLFPTNERPWVTFWTTVSQTKPRTTLDRSTGSFVSRSVFDGSEGSLGNLKEGLVITWSTVSIDKWLATMLVLLRQIWLCKKKDLSSEKC